MPETLQSDFGRLKRVIVKHAREAFGSQRAVAAQWRKLNYAEQPDFRAAVAEYDVFLRLLGDCGVNLIRLPADDSAGMDSLYPRDAAVATDSGVILCRMGKQARASEPAAVKSHLQSCGVKVASAITGTGRLEGGDVVWLDRQTVAVGRGYRTNAEGIAQLRTLLGDTIDELIEVPLPHWRGPADVFHLMSILSPVSDDAVLVHAPLLPVPFREWLMAREITMIDVAPEEFETMAGNVLALAPRRVLMLAGNPRTRARLQEAGIEVLEYAGDEISRKGEGGPTCLTRPLLRER